MTRMLPRWAIVLMTWIVGWASTQPFAQTVDTRLFVDAGIQYFRQAEYQEAIALLSTVDELLGTRSGLTPADKADVKFYLALSYYATGNLEKTEELFHAIYASSLSFVPPEPPPPVLTDMIERQRAEAIATRCPASACMETAAAFGSGQVPASLIDTGCPCFDDAVAAGVSAAQDRLTAGDYCGALTLAERILDLRRGHPDADVIARIARTGHEVAERALFNDWMTQFEAGRYEEAARTVDAIRSGCEAMPPSEVLVEIRQRYRDALDLHVQRWQAACRDMGRPGRERRGTYDEARRTVAELDDGTGVNEAALAATDDSQCQTPPCQLIVPYPGVDALAPWTNPRPGLAGHVVVAFEIGVDGRVVRPEDPAWFRMNGSPSTFFDPVRSVLTEWQFDPTPVPVCTMIEIRFQ